MFSRRRLLFVEDTIGHVSLDDWNLGNTVYGSRPLSDSTSQ
jgi:hypothetical protein